MSFVNEEFAAKFLKLTGHRVEALVNNSIDKAINNLFCCSSCNNNVQTFINTLTFLHIQKTCLADNLLILARYAGKHVKLGPPRLYDSTLLM